MKTKRSLEEPPPTETLEERAFELYAYTKRTVYRLRRDPRCTPRVLAMATRMEKLLFSAFNAARARKGMED